MTQNYYNIVVKKQSGKNNIYIGRTTRRRRRRGRADTSGPESLTSVAGIAAGRTHRDSHRPSKRARDHRLPAGPAASIRRRANL